MPPSNFDLFGVYFSLLSLCVNKILCLVFTTTRKNTISFKVGHAENLVNLPVSGKLVERQEGFVMCVNTPRMHTIQDVNGYPWTCSSMYIHLQYFTRQISNKGRYPTFVFHSLISSYRVFSHPEKCLHCTRRNMKCIIKKMSYLPHFTVGDRTYVSMYGVRQVACMSKL